MTPLITTYAPEHIVVRLYLPWERIPQQHSLDQIASALANGCTIGGYCWPYPEADPGETVREALALADRAGVTLPILWLDLETYNGQPGPDADWVLEAAATCEARSVRCGCYSARWYLEAYMADSTRLGHLPLWLAEYDQQPTFDGLEPPPGWTQVDGKQWTNTPVDRSVFLESVTR